MSARPNTPIARCVHGLVGADKRVDGAGVFVFGPLLAAVFWVAVAFIVWLCW